MYIALQGTPEDWSFKAQDPITSTGYKNSVTSWAKGKVLGGSSTINAMVTVPGVPEDYDHWAELGNEGWDWSNVTKYFDKVEEMVKITRYRSNLPMRTTLEAAIQELGIDTTGSSTFGYRDVPIQVNEGQRYSHAKAYLTPIRDRENLCVVTEMQVIGILFDEETNIQGVTVNDSFNNEIQEIKANIEVILSAGAINPPQILMLSGIGVEDHLEELDIPTKVNLPVGRNLMDHMIIPVFIQEIIPLRGLATSLEHRINEYCENGTILDTLGITNFQGYLNTQNNSRLDNLQRPNVEIIHFSFPPQEPMLPITLDKFGYLDYYRTQLEEINQDKYIQMILIEVLHPQSRGTVELSTTDPYTQPRITPNYLSHPRDVQIVLEGASFIEAHSCLRVQVIGPVTLPLLPLQYTIQVVPAQWAMIQLQVWLIQDYKYGEYPNCG